MTQTSTPWKPSTDLYIEQENGALRKATPEEIENLGYIRTSTAVLRVGRWASRMILDADWRDFLNKKEEVILPFDVKVTASTDQAI